LAAVGAKSVAVVSPPRGVKDGWDAADALDKEWTPDDAVRLIDNATPADASSQGDDEARSWDNPDLSLMDDRRGELPPFPLDVLSLNWQDWAKRSAHGAGTAIDYVVVPLFGIASSLIGTARRLRASTSWSQPFTLWIAAVGSSGAGKTPGMHVSQGALARIERNQKHLIGELRRAHERKIESAKATKKQWQDKVKDAVEAGQRAPDMPPEAETPEPFEAPRLFVSNATIEKLAVLLQARPQGMLVIFDELAGLFLNLSRYSGGTDKEFWLEAHNGNPYRVERMNRPAVDLEYLLVGLVGGFQPDKLSRSLDGDADGIYARMLFSWPEEMPYRPLTDDVTEIDPELENVLTKLVNVAEFEEEKLIVRYVKLTRDAKEVFEQFRQLVHRKKGGLDGREREWWVKTPAHVLRLAGTFGFLDWAMESAGTPAPTTTDARFMTGAVRLMTEYFWPHARAALCQIGLTERHAKARKVLRWLRAERGPGDEVSVEDIRVDALGRTVDAKGAQELIDTLVKAHWHRWQINPRLWSLPEMPGIPESPTTEGDIETPQPEARLSGVPGISGKGKEISSERPSGANGRYRISI
jgi:hypothetical protein